MKIEIMPLICLRCKKDIPLTMATFKEISYTHYSYCEECIRKGLQALRTIEEIKKCIEFHKLDEVDEMGLTGFEGFVIEQIKEADH